jgi:Tfp pilus assembly protein PilO
MPRIVTQHDINIIPRPGDQTTTKLNMGMTARTYRYLEQDEIDAQAKGNKGRK